MKLITKDIQTKIPPLYSTEHIPLDEKLVHVKYFTTWSHWTWLITEASAVVEDESGSELFTALRDFADTIEKMPGYYKLKNGEIAKVVDIYMFGWVYGDFPEWGSVSLKELQGVIGPWGLKIERDMYCDVKQIKEFREWQQ
jgi:hypothetical protein